MKKKQQIILTGKQSEQLLKEGKTIYSHSRIGHVVELVDGKACVTGLIPLEEIEYDVVVRY